MITTTTRARFTVVDADLFVPVPFPAMVTVGRLAIVKAGGGAFTINLYNRRMISDTIDIQLIRKAEELGGSGNPATQVAVASAHGLQPGDTVTIAGCSNASYDGDYSVLRVVDNFTVVLDVDFIDLIRGAAGDSGTLAHATPSAEWPLFKCATVTEAGWTNPAAFDYNNQDPDDNTGAPRIIWAKASATGDYFLAADVSSNT